MNLVIHHTLRSVRKYIVQIVVIVMAVIVATIMLFASFSVSDIFYNIHMLEYARTAQDADMLIGDNTTDGVPFSRTRITNILHEYDDSIEYAEYFLKFGTIMRTKTSSKAIQVEATDLKEYFDRHTVSYIERDTKENSDLVDIIIPQSFAEEAGISGGDEVEIFLTSKNMYIPVHVAYIARNEGIFSSKTMPVVLIDINAVRSDGLVSAVYVKFNAKVSDTASKIVEIKERIHENFAQIAVQEGNSASIVRDIVRQNTLLFTIAILFIVGTMMLILLTSYQIIVRHRMREMVLFKAVGATPLQTACIMEAEVAFYGIIGAGLGVLLGRLIMQVVVNNLFSMAKGAITFDAWKYVASFILGIVVALFAALIPILSVSKKTIRELTSSEGKGSLKKENPILCVISYVFMIGIIVTVHYSSGTFLVVMMAIFLVAMALAIKYSVGYILKGVGYVIGKIIRTGSPKLASIEAGRNRSMRMITLLISVLIAFSFLIVEVVGLVKTAVEPFRGRYDADIVTITSSKYQTFPYAQTVSSLLSINGVEKCGYFNSKSFLTSLDIVEEENTLTIYGVSDYQTLTMCCPGGLSDGIKEFMDTTTFPLVISQEMSLRMGWKIGDTVDLAPYDEAYRSEVTMFTIIGIDYTYSEWDVIGYCPFGLLEDTYGVADATFLIKTDGTSDTTFLDVRDYFDNVDIGICYVLPFEEWAYAGKTVLSGVSILLTILQYAIYAVSLLGVINIAVVTIFDRRKEIALYMLCGMTSEEYRKFSLAEGITVGISGGILGCIIGIGINQVLPIIGTLIARHIDFGFFPATVGYSALFGCAFFLVIWFILAISNKDIKLLSRQ